MTVIYVESIPEFELVDLVDDIVMNSQTITDRSKKRKLIKVGAGFDIETSKIGVGSNKYGLAHIAFCYRWQFGLGEYCFKGRTLDSMKWFFESIVIDSIERLKPKCMLMVLDANLGYEFQFCKHYWNKIGITDVFAKEKRDPLYVELKSTIQFREVIGLFGKSLDHIASNYCTMRKLIGDLDFDIVRYSDTELTEEEEGYTTRDVEILVELAETYIYKNYYGTRQRMPLTQTGIVRDEIKKKMGKDIKNVRKEIASWMPEELEYELFRIKLFKGGISGTNIMLMNKILKDVRGADITSDYPYQILTKKFPMGKAELWDNGKFMDDDLPYIAIIRFHKFKAKSHHALMSAHKVLNTNEMRTNDNTVLDNNRIQYGEFVELIINDVEFKALQKAYSWKHMLVKKCWKFTKGYAYLPQSIREVCLAQYLKKQSLKAEHSDTLEYKIAKEFVNSIFGMMCTALYMEDFIFDEKYCDIIVEEDESGNKVTRSYDECCSYLYLSPYWGFWITSYARSMLMDVITRFPRVIVQYDTDSVYFIDNGSDDAEGLKKYLEAQNQKMRAANRKWFLNEPLMETIGTWDFTPKYKRFKALGSKRYMYETENGKIKCVVAGCRKDKETGESTIKIQNDYNNEVNGTDVDIFDFFSNNMRIDKQHSNKLASVYVDIPFVVTSNGREIKIPSCVVLEPVEFNMRLSRSHFDLMVAVHRYMENTKDRKVYDIWKELKNLSTSKMTPTLESTMIGNLSLENTENWESLQSTT